MVSKACFATLLNLKDLRKCHETICMIAREDKLYFFCSQIRHVIRYLSGVSAEMIRKVHFAHFPLLRLKKMLWRKAR